MAKKETENKEPTIDKDAPKYLRLSITDNDGVSWGEMIAEAKEFKTGSKGFYAQGKVNNLKSGLKYSIGCNIILSGSKPA